MQLPSRIFIELKAAYPKFSDKLLGTDPASLLDDFERSFPKSQTFEARARCYENTQPVSLADKLHEPLGRPELTFPLGQFRLLVLDNHSLEFDLLLPIRDLCLGQPQSLISVIIREHLFPPYYYYLVLAAYSD